MDKRYKPYIVLLLITLVLLMLGAGCRTRVGLGFAFGSEGSSVSLEVSSIPSSEAAGMWTVQIRALPA